MFKFRGISDIIGVIPFGSHKGIMIAIECKRPTTRNRLTEDQKRFINRVKECGGVSGVCTSIEDVKEMLIGHGVINGEGMPSLS